mgnify:CR=1 FL=1
MRGTKSGIRRKIRRKKMIEQKLIGIAALLLCVVIVVFALHGKTPEDRDVTPVLLMAPLGFYLLFSKECWLY